MKKIYVALFLYNNIISRKIAYFRSISSNIRNGLETNVWNLSKEKQHVEFFQTNEYSIN